MALRLAGIGSPEVKIGQLSQENVSSSTNSASFRTNVTGDSGIVTEDSGRGRKSVTFNQNRRSRSVGTTGHVQTESAVNMVRNTHFWQKMRKSLGSKRKELSPEHIDDITRLFGQFREFSRDSVPISRIFKNEEFGYSTITVERPERDAIGKIVLGSKGKGRGQPVPDAALRDTENVPLSEDIETYFNREVMPHAPDAWIDHEKTKVGYEIPFNRHFYVYKSPRPLIEIDKELKAVTDRILTMIGNLTK